MKCQFCDKECKNKKSLVSHERLCKLNPNKIVCGFENYNKVGVPWNKGLNKDDARIAEAGKKISTALTGKSSKTTWTDEMRKAQSERKKQLFKDRPDAHPNRKVASNRNKMTYPEKIAYDFLTENEIEFEHNKKIGKYFPDFVIGNTIIEIDGARWHDQERDALRDKNLNELGFKVIRIDTKQRIIEELNKILPLLNRWS